MNEALMLRRQLDTLLALAGDVREVLTAGNVAAEARVSQALRELEKAKRFEEVTG